jgi:hypothetical protein
MRDATESIDYAALVKTHGTISAAAAAAGMAKTTFFKRYKKVAPITPKTSTVEEMMASLVESQRMIAALLTGPKAPVLEGSPQTAKTEKAPKPEKPVAGGTYEAPEAREIRVGKSGVYLVALAQNNTFVHADFLASMATYQAERNARLLVVRCSYNANAYGKPHEVLVEGESSWYDPAIQGNVVTGTIRLAPDLVLCADMNISPSAVDPLSGLESFTKTSSGIFGHTKHEMRPMASMKGSAARFLYTTGAVTLSNYIPRKAGQKAEHHHILGALVVEVEEDGSWFVRQINATSDGCFQDLDRVYTPTGSHASHIEAITPGDIHREKFTDRALEDAIWAPGGMLDALKPKYQFIHDLTDFTVRNHHNVDSPYFLARQYAKRDESVEEGMEQCAAFLQSATRPWCQTVVVESNHDQAFMTWLERAEGHKDRGNQRYWHYWNYKIFQSIESGAEFLPFEAAVREKAPALGSVRFLREDESFITCPESGGIENSLHGHRGVNGSRGSTKGYRVIGMRTISAHTHAAGIWGGNMSSGVSGDLDMTYNRGPSSWSHSLVITYPNGKRAIVTMRGPKWRATKNDNHMVERPRIRVKAYSVAA